MMMGCRVRPHDAGGPDVERAVRCCVLLVTGDSKETVIIQVGVQRDVTTSRMRLWICCEAKGAGDTIQAAGYGGMAGFGAGKGRRKKAGAQLSRCSSITE